MTRSSYKFTVPPNTTVTNPFKKSFELPMGHIDAVEVRIPDGHKGMAHFRIDTPGTSLVPGPLSAAVWVEGDGDTIDYSFDMDIHGPPYVMTCTGYNDDGLIGHSFHIRVDTSPKQEGVYG